jgi:hypothetical protein
MKSIPISVWLAAVVLFIFSGNSAWNNPTMFLEALFFTTVAASFARILYWFIEEKTDEN